MPLTFEKEKANMQGSWLVMETARSMQKWRLLSVSFKRKIIYAIKNRIKMQKKIKIIMIRNKREKQQKTKKKTLISGGKVIKASKKEKNKKVKWKKKKSYVFHFSGSVVLFVATVWGEKLATFCGKSCIGHNCTFIQFQIQVFLAIFFCLFRFVFCVVLAGLTNHHHLNALKPAI